MIQVLLVLAALAVGGRLLPAPQPGPPDSPLTLWYTQPATRWVEALPIGNGRLGGMIFGGAASDRVQLNEDTLWAGGPYDPSNPAALGALPEVRRLIFDGRYRDAQTLIADKMMAKPLRQMPYQPLGDLALTFADGGGVQEYRRDLDLDTAVARVAYTSNGVSFTREYFSSAVDQVLVVRLTASRRGALTLRVALSTPQANPSIATADDSTVVMRGRNAEAQGIAGALRYAARLRVVAQGGATTAD